MPEPRVSILMCTYDRPQLIGRAIASACNQTLADWELIIVQDGNNAETARLLEKWLADEPRIRYFPRGIVGCIAEASNYGLERAHGEYIAVLDDDDYWSDPGKLERQIAFLDENPEYVACGGGYVVVDEHDRKRAMFFKPEKDEHIRARALLANPIANSAAVFRREVNGRQMFYDDSIDGFADWDFWLMLGGEGKLYNFPQCLIHYTLWGGSGSFKASKRNARAALRIVQKHRGRYGGFSFAYILACMNYCYASLPVPIRRVSYASLSAMKKALTGVRAEV